MTIPFNNFVRDYQSQKIEIDQAIKRVLDSGWFILGKEVEEFEKEMAKYIGCKYCVTVANGTEAIALALQSAGIQPGEEVITTNMTAYPTITGIQQAGATPVVIDIDEQTGLMNLNNVATKITQKTRAILPVHIYGQACNMDQAMSIAKQYNLKLIEDCAQSFGAKYKNQMTGTFGITSAFSFYPTKNLGAYGDGGAVCTNDRTMYELLKQLRNYGQSVRYYHETTGINSRLDEIQAAILREKLKTVGKSIDRRRKIADYYNQNLRNVAYIHEAEHNFHTYHLFVLKLNNRDTFMKFMKEKGIDTIIHYPVPIQQQKAYSWQKNETFPHTVNFTNMIVSIPLYPELTDNEVEYITRTVNSFSHA